MKKIGWVVSQMGPAQLNYEIIKSSNDYLSGSDDVDITGFWVNDGPKPLQPKFSWQPLAECFAYDGNTIATSLHTLSRILSYPGPNRNKRLYYYTYDLDYMRIPPQNRQWESFRDVMFHPKVDIVVRSQDHYEIIKSVFREPVAIISDCNVVKFRDLIYAS